MQGEFAGHKSSDTCPVGTLPVSVGSGDAGGNYISLLGPPNTQQIAAGIVKKRDEAIQEFELLSSLVSSGMNQAATWSGCVASIPFLKCTPVITLAR